MAIKVTFSQGCLPASPNAIASSKKPINRILYNLARRGRGEGRGKGGRLPPFPFRVLLFTLKKSTPQVSILGEDPVPHSRSSS
jgi:hypothetical protein